MEREFIVLCGEHSVLSLLDIFQYSCPESETFYY